MAVSFIVRTTKSKGDVPISVRVRSSILNINILQKTNLLVDYDKWRLDRSKQAWANFRKSEDGRELFAKLDAIEDAIEKKISDGVKLSSKDVQEIIEYIVYREAREDEARKAAEAAAAEAARKAAEEEANRMTFNKYFRLYVQQIENGERQSCRGMDYSPNSIRNIRDSLRRWEDFQASKQTEYDFDDVNIRVYNEFTLWMKSKEYSINYIGKNFSILKTILLAARSEGYHKNDIVFDRKFKRTYTNVDTIYLTREELNKIFAVDLSECPESWRHVRDIFMVGCWTAQRVSDYNNIRKEDFEIYTRKFVVEAEDPENPGKKKDVVKTEDVTYLNFRQKKTGAKVAVPVSSQLKEIMERYDYQLPHHCEQTLNKMIKYVGKMAGIDDMVEIVTTKGGVLKREKFHKYELITSHTARRTGATLMYLAGLDLYDIMKITGHASPQMLRRYIRADELQVMDKIKGKYNYFD